MDKLHALDSHCHLFHPGCGADADSTLARAAQAGVEQVIDIGCWAEPEERQQVMDFAAARYPQVSCVIGLHPHDASRFDSDTALQITNAIKNNPFVVGIGETGLDYHYMHSTVKEQQAAFRKAIRIAGETGAPIVIHTREAEEDTLRILREEKGAMGSDGYRGVIHCFTSSASMAQACLDLGFHIGFTGVITFKGQAGDKLRQIAASIPDHRLLVETDSPYLAPVPLRGQPNEPAYLIHTINYLAQLRGTSPARLALLTAENARTLFNLPVFHV